MTIKTNIKLSTEEQEAYEEMLNEYNAQASSPLTEDGYAEAVLHGLIKDRVKSRLGSGFEKRLLERVR